MVFGKNCLSIFFKIILRDLKVITASKNLTNVKSYKSLRIYPSEIDSDWKKGLKNTNIQKAKLFYLGRLKKKKEYFH